MQNNVSVIHIRITYANMNKHHIHHGFKIRADLSEKTRIKKLLSISARLMYIEMGFFLTFISNCNIVHAAETTIH